MIETKRRTGSRPNEAVTDPGTVTIPVPSTLPQFRDAFIGRDREEATVLALLTRPESRLITLTGPGGVGKTRLAASIANQAEPSFPDGVEFVSMVSIPDPDRVLNAIARAIGLQEFGTRPLSDRLIDLIASQHRLLVLDNLEHVLAASPQIGQLLASCPNLVVLATSRERLNLAEEREILVHSLGLPPQGGTHGLIDIASSDAVRLFVLRARIHKPGFDLTTGNAAAIAAICARLDGLALAIELAAARIVELSPLEMQSKLAERLPLLTGGPNDAPARHQTMHAAIAWSYDLLRPEEQLLFRRLGVFGGSFSLEAIERIVGPDLAIAESPMVPVQDRLASLVAKNLLLTVRNQAGAIRYRMLETVREFAIEQLIVHDEESSARDDHAAWFVGQGEQLWQSLLREPIRGERLDWAETEHDNFRAALIWMDRSGGATGLLRLIGAIWPFWFLHSHMAEWEYWTLRAIPHISAVPLRVRGLYMQGAARAVAALGRPLGGISGSTFTAQSLSIFRELDDSWGVATALYAMGADALDDGRLIDARDRLLESVHLLEEIGDFGWRSLSIQELGEVAFAQGDLREAKRLFEEAHAQRVKMSDPWGIAWTGSFLGLIAAERDEFPAAARYLRQSLPYWRAAGTGDGQLRWVARVGILMIRFGELERGVRLLGSFQSGTVRIGARIRPAQLASSDAALRIASARMDSDLYLARLDEGRATAISEAILLAEDALQLIAPEIPTTTTDPDLVQLTRRQRDVLLLLAKGCQNQEIADELFISRRTTATHIDAIYRKLGVSTRAAAAAYAVRHGLD